MSRNQGEETSLRCVSEPGIYPRDNGKKILMDLKQECDMIRFAVEKNHLSWLHGGWGIKFAEGLVGAVTLACRKELE